MRKLISRAIDEIPALTSEFAGEILLPKERIYQAGSVDETPECPFAVIRISGSDRTPSSGKIRRMEVWVHDDRGSYVRIDNILRIIEGAINEKSFAWPEWPGELIAQFDWTSDSSDLTDDGFNTNTRWAAYNVVGRSNDD